MRHRARQAFEWGPHLVLTLVILQVLLAGLGIFVSWPTFLGLWHALIGATLLFFVPLLLILAGWYGGVPVRTRLLMGAIPALVLLQSLLLIPYHAGSAAPPIVHAISALHVVNAFAIFWIALKLVGIVRREARAAD